MENKYLKNGIKSECNGCGICSTICPVNAIRMKEDEEGFLYPVIDEDICIKCNKCKNYCSNFNNKNTESEVYRGINKDVEDLKISSSGGIFLLFAKEILKENGIVFGVRYDENLRVIHDFANNLDDAKKFCGSKYVRSDLNDTYKKCKRFLEQGKKVLFTGTSCQVQGLNVYLGKNYENLITMDIICHANPSPKVFKLYIDELERKTGKKIKNISFRSKKNGWRNQTPIIEYDDGSSEEEKTFIKAFLRELINRDCCFNCKFASKYRISDVTIGDFWGIEKIEPNIDYSNGASIFLVNSEKAKQFLEKIEHNVDMRVLKFDSISQYNHFSNVIQNERKYTFYRKLNKDKKNVITLMEKYSKITMKNKIKRKIKNIFNR